MSTATFPRTGVAYIALLEHEYLSSKKLTVCNNCLALGLTKPLKRCNGCLLIDYCSKECQKANWKKHKAFCNMVQGKGKRNAYLTALTKEAVLRVVIDAYRLRMEMDHSARGEDHGIYWKGKESQEGLKGLVWAEGDVMDDFQRWLDLCEEAGILPEWWRFEDRMQTLSEAIDKTNEESVHQSMDQDILIQRYEGDTSIRNVLNILGELVVGYDGKGRAMNDEWYMDFSEFLDLHPEERARLIQGTIEAVKGVDLQNQGVVNG